MLTIEPLGGLCNRMRAIDGAVALSQDTGMPLRLIWNLNKVLGAPFQDLFQDTDLIAEIVVREKSGKKTEWDRVFRHLDFRTPRAVLVQKDIERLVRQGFDFTSLARRRRPHVRTNLRFHRSFDVARLFRPTQALSGKIEQIASRFENCIGVHIRRADHWAAIKYSPTALFIERMQNEVAARQETTFFLATDDAETEREIAERFPGRILTHSKRSYDRSHPKAIADAVIDLFCLSRTERIFGSLASSFSEVAAELSGAPLETIAANAPQEIAWRKPRNEPGARGSLR